ncbi:uncharacterized protein LOC135382438 [Ornithodoros turicata]|uniref:uncharacterized protein LOC135382438 n=1 Tax=Ornithodoros turicata TaxID=34597 RepID=UPI0031387272
MDRLRMQRAPVHARITMRLDEIRSILQRSPPSREELGVKFDVLNTKASVLKAEIEAEAAECDRYLEEIATARLAAQRYLNGPRESSTTTPARSGGPSGHSLPYAASLPKLRIEPTIGDLFSWQSFWDQFNAAVHNNPNLSNVLRFQYPRSLVKGKAELAIKGLDLTNDNYPAALKILKNQFGNRDKLVSEHLATCRPLPTTRFVTTWGS